MGLQAPHPGHRPSCGTLGDPGERSQPRLRPELAIGLIAVPGGERGQYRGPRGGQARLGLLQAGQDLGLGVDRQLRRLAGGQE
jgi:hypothetical protein